MTKYTLDQSKGKTEFGPNETKELEALRGYVQKLRELGSAIAKDFPNLSAVSKIQFEIDKVGERIVDLELAKIQSELKITS